MLLVSFLSQEVLHLANSDLQEAATKAFVKIIEAQIVPANVYAQTFLQTIQLNVDNRDPGKSQIKQVKNRQ